MSGCSPLTPKTSIGKATDNFLFHLRPLRKFWGHGGRGPGKNVPRVYLYLSMGEGCPFAISCIHNVDVKMKSIGFFELGCVAL